MTDQFDLDADLFLRVRRAQGIEETRYYLHGVLIEPIEGGGAWIVAADGHAMLVARDDAATAPRRAVIRLAMPEVPAPDSGQCDEGCCALMPASYQGARLRFCVEPGASTVAQFVRCDTVYQEAIASDLGCEDKYPAWRKVWASSKALEPRRGHRAWGIGPALLDRITGGDVVSLRNFGEGAAMQMLFNGHEAITGLLMPCDLSGTNYSEDLIEQIMREASHD